MKKSQFIPSVNFHVWEPCNMRCKFCFATFQDVKSTILPKGHLPKEQAIEVVKQLAKFGFKKITFAGGEPTICPWLSQLIQAAKDFGMTTMIVTNGSHLTVEFLEKNKALLDWIAISIDSLDEATNLSIGRAKFGKRAFSKEYYISVIEQAKRLGYSLKINTVVNSFNYNENMVDFIQKVNPKRWKVFQVLPMEGQNDKHISEFIISKDEFEYFLDTHKTLECTIPESNDEMRGSYVMVDPAGRFFDNTNGVHKYSKPILEVGCEASINEMDYSFSKFMGRGGIYDWRL